MPSAWAPSLSAGAYGPYADAPMGMPRDIGIVDTMIGFPHRDMKEAYRFITRQTKDAESKEQFAFPVEYIFKDVPGRDLEGASDPIGTTMREMDLWGVEKGMITIGDAEGLGVKALANHPDRFIASTSADPNDGMPGIARLVSEHEKYGIRAVSVFPAGTFPQVPINDKKMYPIYAKCVELGVPVFCCAGIPGPRLKADVPARRAHRRGHVRLPRPRLRHPPRL